MSDQNMRLENASEEDAEIVYQIKREAYADYAVQAYGAWDETFHRAFTKKNLPRTRLIIFDGSVAGWVAVERGSDEHEIIELHILPRHQRKGLGQAVVRFVIDEAHACQRPVALRVLKINPARAFYERLGFVAIGENATHVIMKRPNQSPTPPTLLTPHADPRITPAPAPSAAHH